MHEKDVRHHMSIDHQGGVRLSIITPVFNGIRFIESCIINVIEQNCRGLEHIIIDGGSSDGTVDVIRAYAKRYGHIKWISEKDKGQSDAMNKGIRMAQGDILGFLNVDDFYEPNVLCRIIEYFKTLPEPSLIVGNCHRWNDQGEIYEENRPAKLGMRDLMLGWNINPCPVNPSQYFYHKSLHDKMGLYDEDEHLTLDIDFILRAVQVANVIYFDEFWGNYRFLRGSKTFDDEKRAERYRAILRKYEKKLPLEQRMLITTTRLFCGLKHLINRFRYFVQHPGEFFSKLISAITVKRNE